jgi:hypothetical protein
VGCFHEILSDNFILKKDEKENNPENKENKNYYWDFISKHFNTPVVNFAEFSKKVKLIIIQ